MKVIGRILLAAIGSIALATTASASSLTYHPTNPTFGGNPLNGTFLLSQAQAQGKGTKSGNQGPDLSGLSDALSNIGGGNGANPPIVIIEPNGTVQTPASP